MSKIIPLAGAAVLMAGLLTAKASAADVGVAGFTFDAPHRDRLVQSLLFYPADGGGMVEYVGANAVFRGELLRRDARPQAGKHKLVIVSHGSGGNAAGMAWLARRLAEAGFVVAIPNHQGSTSGDSTPETTIPAMWQRPADLSRLLDALAASPSVSAFTDTQHVTALGFSLGGAVALNLAGARFEAKRLAAFCDAEPEAIGCPWFAHGNALIPGHVDLHRIDASRFNASYVDRRIGRVVAIDPGFVPALDAGSLAAIDIPVGVVNLGDIDALPSGLRADQVTAAVPNGDYAAVSGAIHFDFLPECKWIGRFLVWMEGDDPVCTTGRRSRADLHADIADRVLGMLGGTGG